jgi:hypothetical protein
MNGGHPSVLIVGAGMCGLMAATELARHGYLATVVDKGASVGGRLATRRIGPGRADHGAQFFTARDPAFEHWVDRWLTEELAFRWSTGWSNGSLDVATPDGYPRYAVRGGMNSLAKAIARNLEMLGVTIRTGVRVTHVAADGAGWRVDAESGEQFTASTLVLTAPAPQSLTLLEASNVPLAAADRTALAHIEYAPCLCGLFWVAGYVSLPEPGARQTPGADITWIADNQRKGISPDARLITVHAGPDYSRRHYDAADAEALAPLQAEVESLMAPGAVLREAQLKRWRYSLPTALHPQRYLLARDLPPLYLGGDAFGGPRVEGAALSGLAIGQAITA